MLTPFRTDLSIDWDALDRLIDRYAEAGVAGLFAVCLSSEMFDLGDKERLQLAEHIVDRAPANLPVIASGTFGSSPQEVAENTRRMAETGVASVVCLSGAMAAEDADTLAWQYQVGEFLARTGDIPLGLYECPRPYHRLLEASALAWAASTERFSFLKETSGQTALVKQKLRAIEGSQLKLFDAVATTLLESLRGGAHGFSGISGNFVPELWVWLCQNFRQEPAMAERLSEFLCEAEPVFSVNYPASAKRFLFLRGLEIGAACRTRCNAVTIQHERELRNLKARADQWGIELGLDR